MFISTFPNGGKYVGEWKDSNMNGQGVLFKVNGKIYSGTWVNNNFIDILTIESVDNHLKNKYHLFKRLSHKTQTDEKSPNNNSNILW